MSSQGVPQASTEICGGHGLTAEQRSNGERPEKTPMVLIIRALTIAYAITGAAGIASAENWPGWRGPNATGVSSETALPETWSDKTNVAWRSRLTGAGVSSPVVWGGQVFVTSQIGAGASSVGPRLGQGADQSDTERSL